MRRWFGLTFVVFAAPLLAGSDTPLADDVLVRSMKDELARTTEKLRLDGFQPPYYVALSATDESADHCAAQDGGLLADDHLRTRRALADVRVGSPKLDSGNTDFAYPEMRGLPLEDDYGALRRTWWLLIDRSYKRAAEALEKRRARRRRQQEPPPPTFVLQPEIEAPTSPAIEPREPTVKCTDLVAGLSSRLRDAPGVTSAEVTAIARDRVRTFVSTEGGIGETRETSARLSFVLRGVGADEKPLTLFRTIDADHWEELPKRKDLEAVADGLAAEFAELAAAPAPSTSTYTGPVLFEGRAAAQLLRQVLVPRLLGTPPRERVRDADDEPAHSSALRIGRRVLPRAFDAVDDPTVSKLAGVDVYGSYDFDHEGIPAARVSLIENGEVNDLLASRTPSRTVEKSNGHGRLMFRELTATPANLAISATGGQGAKALRRRLLRRAKDEGLDHAYVVRLLDDGDVTRSGSSRYRFGFGGGEREFEPLLVYRLEADGKLTPVPGARVSVPRVRDLRHIVAWGTDVHLDHDTGYRNPGPGYFAAGGFPSPNSVVAPDLLLEELDLRIVPSGARGPTYPPPSAE